MSRTTTAPTLSFLVFAAMSLGCYRPSDPVDGAAAPTTGGARAPSDTGGARPAIDASAAGGSAGAAGAATGGTTGGTAGSGGT
ncbi:MAG TPA: hypothetical protein VJ801_13285, partial [Polyangia bacterium]|nr:hypothetical protein [Polyangia bacterium]